MKIDLLMSVTFVHAKVHVLVETCATNEDKNITSDSFVLLFLFLFCFVFCRLPLDNKFPYFALKFYLFLILIPEGWEILAKDSLSCLIHYFNKLTTIRVCLHSKVFERRPRSQSPLLFVREDPGNEIIVSPAIIWLKWKINPIITFLLLRSLYSEKCTLSILCDT